MTPREQSAQEYAEEVANELINEFGEHNFPAFLKRLNEILKQQNK